jgi:hypothetical protein
MIRAGVDFPFAAGADDAARAELFVQRNEPRWTLFFSLGIEQSGS